jgi:cytoskeletal protein RodZ
MSDKTPVGDSVDPAPTDSVESTDGPEAHSRRRALVILVVVVVVALVAALVIWSVTSANSPTPGAAPTASASASASSGSDDPSADPEPSASAPADDPVDGGEVTDDIREFDEEAPAGDAVTVALSDLEAVEGEASTPGEIAGPSLRFTVTFTNDGDSSYSLAGAVTNVYYGEEQTPAIALAEPGGSDFPAEVAPGESATGTFVYNVPADQRDQVRITVDYDAAEPALVFEGSAPQ